MASNPALPANLDLDAILATLAGLQKPQDEQALQHPPQPQEPFHAPQELSHAQQQHQQHQQHQHHREHTPDPRLAARSHHPHPHPHPQPQAIPKPQSRISTPLIDPATIIDWKQGLRCVSKIAASNPEFAGKVRKLVRDQEGNVGMWEEGRRRVVVEQRGKREGEVRRRGEL